MSETDSWSDEQLAGWDLEGQLRQGVRGDDGRVRDELRGVGCVAAAVRLERAGIDREDVEFEAMMLANEADGIGPPPADISAPELRCLVEAARQGSAGDPAPVRDWLMHVAAVMGVRAAAGAS
jgi:hypothetical protein